MMSNSKSMMQYTTVIFLVCVLVFMQGFGMADTPLYGVLLTLTGPSLAGLLTSQAIQSTIAQATQNNATINGNGNGGNKHAD